MRYRNPASFALCMLGSLARSLAPESDSAVAGAMPVIERKWEIRFATSLTCRTNKTLSPLNADVVKADHALPTESSPTHGGYI